MVLFLSYSPNSRGVQLPTGNIQTAEQATRSHTDTQTHRHISQHYHHAAGSKALSFGPRCTAEQCCHGFLLASLSSALRPLWLPSTQRHPEIDSDYETRSHTKGVDALWAHPAKLVEHRGEKQKQNRKKAFPTEKRDIKNCSKQDNQLI